jgi:hypothetical protein
MNNIFDLVALLVDWRGRSYTPGTKRTKRAILRRWEVQLIFKELNLVTTIST